MRIRWVWLLLFTAACVKAPPVANPTIPIQTPEMWTTGEAVAFEIDPEWWKVFGDEELNQVVAEAPILRAELACTLEQPVDIDGMVDGARVHTGHDPAIEGVRGRGPGVTHTGEPRPG